MIRSVYDRRSLTAGAITGDKEKAVTTFFDGNGTSNKGELGFLESAQRGKVFGCWIRGYAKPEVSGTSQVADSFKTDRDIFVLRNCYVDIQVGDNRVARDVPVWGLPVSGATFAGAHVQQDPGTAAADAASLHAFRVENGGVALPFPVFDVKGGEQVRVLLKSPTNETLETNLAVECGFLVEV